MDDQDQNFLRTAFAVALKSREGGNHPFGAVLVDEFGNILLEAGNQVVSTGDCTSHAETNLMKQASILFDRKFLAKCTIYASSEPCPMCSGAIFWANVRRVVYGLSQQSLYTMTDENNEDALLLPCRDLLSHGRKSIEVVGPLLEEEARLPHEGFWT